MSGTTIIPFSFCRIKRAAEFLGVCTDDLLSLAVSEKITLCVMLDGLKSTLLVEGNDTKNTDWYLSLSMSQSNLAPAYNISKYSSFAIDRVSYDEESDKTIFNPLFYPLQYVDGSSSIEESQSHQGRAYGLWKPQLPVINSVLNYGKSSLLWGSLGLYNTDEKTPNLCLIPLAINNDDICAGEDDYVHDEEQFPDIEITVNDLWITADQVRVLLNHNGDYNDISSFIHQNKPLNSDLSHGLKKVGHIAEYHAANREMLLRSAICLLSKYPDECRGERKEISPEKWRDCIINHLDEIPPLSIKNEAVILKHLRSATNNKG
ncbi:Uncharacterised protein [Serratia grimesii]|uniref:hypothetical protein n=1 Tax=Serratia grimesii TaxID=82995 RepID=UPI0021C4E7E6|nr:hypothetical protein [Serratia grimesii]CAI2791788.1 Uncharacterised protein [Serratia grimesii]